ncbi:class I SAM-dependent methyltransferase [Actinocorallia sp. A-T 12471]|uniref:class I SAM-dependent methyltransferase n=1 Tax=Actinocorallia sp. A-T 12471 TaxID=3089813 RepID=UPI0029CD1627|nr:class I SAM-dependent methyltransferase [Actinocorallia sp. A-T 12471]MDX6740146.1 class I SAM-dependent methyltransferase [Actinocorallia sp. A-T 12471]
MLINGIGWALAVLTAGLAADAVFRRSRAARLTRLPDGAAPAPGDAYRLVRAEGVEVPDEVFALAAAHAAEQGLDALDLVPAHLDSFRTLELLLLCDPARYRRDRMAAGVTAGHAIVASADVLDRAGITDRAGLDAVAMDDAAIRLKRYASTGTDLAVADGIQVRRRSAAEHRAILRRRYENFFFIALTGQALVFAAVVAGAVAVPYLGLAVVAAAALRPVLATLGTPLRPRDRLFFGWAQLRSVLGWFALAAARDPEVPGIAEARRQYRAEIAEGVGGLVGERRADCPWCGGSDLRRFLTSGDYQQGKPGTFRLEECRGCGHVFQNPRLTLDGLDFYYRDFYDGFGMEERETAFRLVGGHGYAGRAELVKRHAAPRTWLDVGGGIGHFCEYARDFFPETRLDALDMGAGIVEAERRRWVDRAYHGYFVERVGDLTGQYDVISMHHYLEHTLDPHAELDASAKALDPGGLLLIELPDPQSRFGRLLGRWWHNWLQPQHLHLIPLANLRTALRDRGFEVVESERGAAHQQADFFPALGIALNRFFPNPETPWQSGRLVGPRQALRTAAYLVFLPVSVVALALDLVCGAVIARTDRGANTYRVLARKV